MEWYKSEAGFNSLNLSCASSKASPKIAKIVVTYQDDTPATTTQSQSATAAKSAWEAGVTFHFKNTGDVTLDGSVSTAIDTSNLGKLGN